MIDYIALSKDIGLHAPSLNLIMTQNKRHQNVSKLREYITNAESTLNQQDLQELIKQTSTLQTQSENPLHGLKLNIRKVQAKKL